eukprot:1187025-Prorocentrum_lima.AAC.1
MFSTAEFLGSAARTTAQKGVVLLLPYPASPMPVSQYVEGSPPTFPTSPPSFPPLRPPLPTEGA